MVLNLINKPPEWEKIQTTNKMFKKITFEKIIENPKISLFPITLKCEAERFSDGWEFKLTNNEINNLTTNTANMFFNEELDFYQYVNKRFDSYEFDLEHCISTISIK